MAIRTQNSQKIMVMVISVLLAFLLWLYVMGEKNPIQSKTIVDIPVKLVNTEAITKNNLVLFPNQKFAIDVQITGRAFEISKLTANDIKLEAQLTDQNKKGNNKVYIRFNKIQKKATIVAQKGQEYINVRIDKLVEKKVPVAVNVRGNVKAGYAYLKPIPRPTEVVISGPGSYVNEVLAAVGQISVNGNYANVSGSISLKPEDKNGKLVSNVNVVPTYIDTTVSIKPFKEVPIKISTYGIVDANKIIRSIKPQVERILLVGEHKYIDKLNEIKTTEVDLSQITKTTTMQLALDLPLGVEVIDDLNRINTVIIVENRVDKIMTLTPPIINKDSAYHYIISDEKISVILSGPESVMNTLNEKSVETYIDLNGYLEGTYEVPIIVNPIKDVEVRNISPLKTTVDITKKQ